MKKRILMVAYACYHSDVRIRREAEALIERGYEVDIVVQSEMNRPRTETVCGVGVHRLSAGRYRGAGNLRYIFSYFRFFVEATIKVNKLFSRRKYDAVHVHTMPDFMVFTALVPKLRGAKVVIDIHDMMPELYMSKFGFKRSHLFIRILLWQERRSFSFADQIICVHHLHRDLLVERGARRERISIIMNSPDPRVFRYDESSALSESCGLRLLYHGTIAERHGVDIALAGFALVLPEFPAAVFDIYGSGDFAPDVEALIEKNGLAESVRFRNAVFDVEEAGKFMRNATVGIIPNRLDAATEMMLPTKLLEYAIMRIPAVAAKLKTVSYYFDEESVEFFEPGNPRDLARAISAVFRDPRRRQRLSAGALVVIDNYSWNVMRGELYSLMDHLIGR